jgi:hypothetical protein
VRIAQALGAVLRLKRLGACLVSQRVSASQPLDTAIVQLRDAVQRTAICTFTAQRHATYGEGVHCLGGHKEV